MRVEPATQVIGCVRKLRKRGGDAELGLHLIALQDDRSASRRGVVPGSFFEARCWRNGTIPDRLAAVDGPRRASRNEETARRVLDLIPLFPNATWGRDEQRTGEMKNSNSLTAGLLARSGHHTHALTPHAGGRAPGWSAGLVVASRDKTSDQGEPLLR
jgi:hypothetical protein